MTNRRETFLVHRDHPGIAQDRKVFGNIRLSRPRGRHQLADRLIALHQDVEETQAHRLGQGPEPHRDQLQRDR